jgi:hypothetical protein
MSPRDPTITRSRAARTKAPPTDTTAPAAAKVGGNARNESPSIPTPEPTENSDNNNNAHRSPSHKGEPPTRRPLLGFAVDSLV